MFAKIHFHGHGQRAVSNVQLRYVLIRIPYNPEAVVLRASVWSLLLWTMWSNILAVVCLAILMFAFKML